MSPSTDATEPQRQFAADVLRKLLHRINSANGSAGSPTFVVTHAWSDGPNIFLIYTAPPSNLTWGLVRDTRESIVDGDSWTDVNEASLYYYLLDLEENWPGNFSRQPGESDDIRWMGDVNEDLPTDTTALLDSWGGVDLAHDMQVGQPSNEAEPAPPEPRRYADPY